MDSAQIKYSVDTTIAALAVVSGEVGVATILTRFAKISHRLRFKNYDGWRANSLSEVTLSD